MASLKKVFFLFLIFGLAFQAKAQMEEDETKSFGERAYFGGGFSLQFGDFTYIDLSPMMGYGFTNRFSTGIGFTYRYVNDRFFNYSYNVYGGRLFSRFGIVENIFAHAEFELLNWENPYERQRAYSSAIFIGPGYSSGMGGQKGYQVYVLYNLLYDQFKSPYNEPYVIRFSVTF